MPHNQRIRPPGMWTPNSALLAAEVELFDQAQYLELHEGGGAWALQSNTVIGAVGNASWTFTLPLVVDDLSGHVIAGRALSVDLGATFALAGIQQVEPGALIRVLGQATMPGSIRIGQYAEILLDSGGTLTTSVGSLIDIFDRAVFENGASWRLTAGARGYVDGGGMIYLLGAVAATPAQVVFQQYAQATFWATTQCQFLANSLLVVLPGATARVQGELNFQAPSTITGTPTLDAAATFTVAGTTDFAANAVLNLLAGCLVNFNGTAQLKGSPVFLDSLLLGAAAKATFYTGSTFADGSVRTYSAPQIPWGPDAVNGVATPIVGPIPAAGQTYVDVDLSGVTLINTPQNLAHEIGWTLTVPSHPEVARLVIVRQTDQTKQGYLVAVYAQNTPIVSFLAANGPATTSAALLLWDTKAWTLVFMVGANAVPN